MVRNQRFAILVSAAMLLAVLLALPASALKVYVNPSNQTGNYSPDGAYQEAANMQDVGARLVTKLQARGFEARNSGMMEIGAAMTDSNNWGPDCFISLHTDATGSGGWGSAHGTRAFYYQSSGGWHDDRNVDFANHVGSKIAQKFGAFGRDLWLGTQPDYPWLGWNIYNLRPDIQYAIPTTLIEGLYHDNWDDVYGVLLTTAGRDAYAQGAFEGICDYYGLPYTSTRTPFMVKNQDGRLQAFVRGRVDTKLYTCWQTAVNATTWTSWTAIGSSNYAGNPSAVLDSTGIITVAIRATDGSISNLWQTASNAYGSWSTGGWGGNVAGDAKIVVNQNGNRQVFVRGGNNVLYTNYENPRTSWSGWVAIGVGSYAGDPSVILDNTGILTIAIRHTDGSIRSLWQTAANGYASWGTGTWDGNVPGEPVLALNQNGMRQLFVRGGSGYMHTRYENPRGTWSGWNSINQLTTYAGNPAVVLDQSGRLNVFCRMTNGSEGVYWETNPNSYTTWSSGGLDGVIAYDPAVAKCANGLRQTIIIDSVGTMFLRCETSAGVWGGWNSMAGSP